MPSVQTHFNQSFPFTNLTDPQGLACDMPIASPCGQDCGAAIDAGTALLRHARRALGDNDPFRELIARKVEDIVLTYIYG